MIAGADKLPKYNQIAVNSNLWLYRMVEVGVSQTILLSLYEDAVR